MSAHDIEVIRDSDSDVLYVIKKKTNRDRTVNVSATSDILLRLDPKTRELVGLTIEDFSKLYPDLKDHSDYLLMEHFDHVIALVNASHMAMSRA